MHSHICPYLLCKLFFCIMLQNGETSIECVNTVSSMIEQVFTETLIKVWYLRFLRQYQDYGFQWYDTHSSALKMQATGFSETLVLTTVQGVISQKIVILKMLCVCYLQGLVCDRACQDLCNSYYTEFCWPWETMSPAWMSGFLKDDITHNCISYITVI